MDEVTERDSEPRDKPHLMPFHMYYLTEEMTAKAFTELHESDDTRDKHIQQLRELLRAEEDLVFEDNDDFLLRFLRAKKFDVNKAFSFCKHYYKSIMHHYLLTATRSVVESAVQGGWAGILPYRNTDGSVIAYICIEKYDPSEVPAEEFMQAILSLAWRWLDDPATQVCGCTFILNCKGFNLVQLFSFRKAAWYMAEVLLRCFPIRYKGFHFVHQGTLVTYFWFLVKHLANKKIQSRVHIHGDNVEKLHEFITPEVLPEECGGHLEPFHTGWTAEEMERTTKPFCTSSEYGYKKRKRSFLSSLIKKATPWT